MNELYSVVADSDLLTTLADQSSLVFVDDAEYEFVGGGASVSNGL